MSSPAEDLLRLAWQVDGEGRPATRDALLTLAVAESLPDDPEFAERCRALLSARQPNHWFASPTTHAEALGQTRVVEALAKLRAIFPPVRVKRMLLRGAAQQGPYTGRRVPLSEILVGLSLPKVQKAESAQTKTLHPQSLPFPVPSSKDSGRGNDLDPDGSVVALYWSTLVAMAVVLNMVLDSSAQDSRAA